MQIGDYVKVKYRFTALKEGYVRRVDDRTIIVTPTKDGSVDDGFVASVVGDFELISSGHEVVSLDMGD